MLTYILGLKFFCYLLVDLDKKNHSKWGVVADKIDRGGDMTGVGQVIKPDKEAGIHGREGWEQGCWEHTAGVPGVAPRLGMDPSLKFQGLVQFHPCRL